MKPEVFEAIKQEAGVPEPGVLRAWYMKVPIDSVAEMVAEIERLRARVARIEYRALDALNAGTKEALEALDAELMRHAPLPCPWCKAGMDDQHADGCEVTK